MQTQLGDTYHPDACFMFGCIVRRALPWGTRDTFVRFAPNANIVKFNCVTLCVYYVFAVKMKNTTFVVCAIHSHSIQFSFKINKNTILLKWDRSSPNVICRSKKKKLLFPYHKRVCLALLAAGCVRVQQYYVHCKLQSAFIWDGRWMLNGFVARVNAFIRKIKFSTNFPIVWCLISVDTDHTRRGSDIVDQPSTEVWGETKKKNSHVSSVEKSNHHLIVG